MVDKPTILVLGASGLIGARVTHFLANKGCDVVPVARHFTATQRRDFSRFRASVALPAFGAEALAKLFAVHQPKIVVNAVGVLQDAPGRTTAMAHEGVTGELIKAIQQQGARALLVHISIPGDETDDTTSFAKTKRRAEATIVESGLAHAIIKPGFVVAPAAFGGSALVRALAMTPLRLPNGVADRPFAATDVDDIGRTIVHLAQLEQKPLLGLRASWDVMEIKPGTVGTVIDGFRTHFGQARGWLTLPQIMLRLGALAGDAVTYLGWCPPVRSTALAEMQRGVTGDPAEWMRATGMQPAALADILASRPATIQETWFARLYLLKALIFPGLAIFWIVSGLIALFAAFDAATAILSAHGTPILLGKTITVLSSLMDIGVGALIGWRRTSKIGLMAGVGVSLFYMAGAAVLTPELWIEPLGALVKTGPAIILMLVGLAMLEDR